MFKLKFLFLQTDQGGHSPEESIKRAISNMPTHQAGSIDAALPKPFSWTPNSVAVVMIDWQLDFTRSNGFGALLGTSFNLAWPLPEF